MDDFETFKASREKIDPSTGKFSERQWQKAYAAYRKSRKRVQEGKRSKSGDKPKCRKSSGRSKKPHSVYAHSPVMSLRDEVRQNSAYSDLRMILDQLTWVAIGLIVMVSAVKLSYSTDAIAMVALLNGVVKVVGIVALRMLAHAIIDIPDIALHEGLLSQKDTRKGEEESV